MLDFSLKVRLFSRRPRSTSSSLWRISRSLNMRTWKWNRFSETDIQLWRSALEWNRLRSVSWFRVYSFLLSVSNNYFMLSSKTIISFPEAYYIFPQDFDFLLTFYHLPTNTLKWSSLTSMKLKVVQFWHIFKIDFFRKWNSADFLCQFLPSSLGALPHSSPHSNCWHSTNELEDRCFG